MPELDKKSLTEQDIRTKFITPALTAGGKWDVMNQIREEVYFTKGRVIVRGQSSTRGEPKKADYVLFYKPGIRLAVLEAKDNNHPVGGGMQQALEYGEILDVPFVFSSNGDGFLFHDRTGQSQPVEQELTLDQFPSAEDLWQRYCVWKGLTPAQTAVVAQDYCVQGEDKTPRYYQEIAINRTIEAIAKGQSRILLTMATGTGKTFVAFQIIWRLWKSGRKKRIVFLADRNILVDQTRVNDFKPFAGKITTQPNISLTNAREFPIPVPPLAEQQRIVAKVDELLRWCDALESRLTAAQTTAEHLLDATLHQILAA